MGVCNSTSNSFAGTFDQQLWQDRQIRWDQRKSALRLRNGEVLLHAWSCVEDTKGDNGLGVLRLTNLRVVWSASHNPKLNISLGIGNLSYIHFNMTDSPTFGRIRAVSLMACYNRSRFEFAFAVRADEALSLFNKLEAALRRYRATKVFRDLILRDELLFADGQLVTSYGETLLQVADECFNLTSEETFPGSLHITDRRIVWTSGFMANVNVSVSFAQLRAVVTRESAFGPALVIETTPISGSYVLGFKLVNTKILNEVISLIQKQLSATRAQPFFGPLDGCIQTFQNNRLRVVDPKTLEEEDEDESTDDDSAADKPPSPNLQRHFSGLEISPQSTPVGLTRTVVGNSAVVADNGCGLSASPSPNEGFVDTHVEVDCPAAPQREETSPVISRMLLSERAEMNLPDEVLPFTSARGCVLSDACIPVDSLLTDVVINGDGRFVNISSEETRVNGGSSLPSVASDIRIVACGDGESAEPVAWTSAPPGRTVAAVVDPVGGCGFERCSSAVMRRCSGGLDLPHCVVCLAGRSQVAFDPCGHFCCCQKCSKKVDSCPVCRSEILKALKIFIPGVPA